MSKTKKPVIAITMGDPSGVGPEITAKLLIKNQVYEKCKPLVIADARVIEQGCEIAMKDLKINPIDDIKKAKFEFGTIDVLDLKNISPKDYEFGKVQKSCGKAAGESIKKAIELALSKKVSAVVTNPIHKDSFQLGGFNYAGHTEMFGDLTKTKDYRMVLVHDDLRVIHNSTHVSLKQAVEMAKKDRILKTIELGYEFGKRVGLKSPKVAVCGLNPHCGENGLFGDEEVKEIIPAIEQAKKKGINVEDRPIPSDTVFAKYSFYGYDVIVVMYHDQGHIPLKSFGFKFDKNTKEIVVRGVNITFGLPIIRTSVDHGVAFKKAGKGTANVESLADALSLAVQLVV